MIKESQESEFSRTELRNHAKELGLVGDKGKFDLNSNQTPRIVESLAGQGYRTKDSYMNQKLR